MDERIVLIVDDDTALAGIMQSVLLQSGYRVESAGSCEEARARARETRPHLVLIDLKLPDGSGTDLLAELKKDDPDVYCVILTGHADLESAVAAIENGAFQYLRKPVDKNALLEVVERVFETRQVREERRQVEMALRRRNQESEARYQTLMEAVNDAVVLIQNGKVVYANRAALDLTGLGAGEMLGMEYVHLMDPDERDISSKRYQAALEGTLGFKSRQIRIRHKEGHSIELDVSGSVVIHEGKPALATISRDVTERNRAENALREREEQYRLMAENVSDIIWTTDMNLQFTHVSPAVTKMLGYTVEEVIGKGPENLIVPEDLELASRVLNEEIEKDPDHPDPYRTRTIELRQRHKDGNIVWTEASMRFLRGPEGKPKAVLGVTRDITERRSTEQELRESEARYRAVFEGGTDAILVNGITPNGMPDKFIEANEVAFRSLGYTREELLELSALDLMATDSMSNLEEIAEALFREKRVMFESGIRLKDGREIPTEVTLSLFELAGKPMILTNARNIASRKRSIEELKRAKEAAEAASRYKSEFLGNMGHELRTPLSGIIGIASLLVDTELDSHQRQYTDTIIGSAEALLTIINDLLEFSKSETGRLLISAAPFDVKQAVQEVVAMLGARAVEKGLELEVEHEPDVPAQVVGDAGRIRQVLTNLVDNALKFTDEGKIVVSVRCEDRTSDKAQIVFAVKDSGIGIPEDQLSRIFDSFTQVDGSSSRRHPGIGLGLAISRQLVGLMGGTLQVRSRSGQGSTFWFSLEFPLRFDGAGTDRAGGQPEDSMFSRIRSLQVLVAEDNDVSQEVAATILGKLGCRVELASDGEQAVKMASRKNYDVIFMDCQMPGMDGFEATAEIRRREAKSGERTHIVAMTAHSLEEDRQRCMAAGMDDYIAKPATMNDFKNVLDRLQE